MNLKLQRVNDNGESTFGLFYIDEDFACFTLEDEHRTKKVWGETRIPAGKYEVRLRTEGKFHGRYTKRFPKMHKGMLHIIGIPNFKYVLIHIGNTDDDTAGCLLVGDTVKNNVGKNGKVESSTIAYKRIYPPIAKALLEGERVTIEILDEV